MRATLLEARPNPSSNPNPNPNPNQVQATLLAAHPLSAWSIIDLVRAGAAGGEIVLEMLAALEVELAPEPEP